MNCFLDEVLDEREEEQEDAGGEQWFNRIK